MGGVFENRAAFRPFYDERVVFEGDGERVEAMCLVLDLGYDDPVAEDSTGTIRRVIEVSVPEAAWPSERPVRTGDMVTTRDFARYAVMEVGRLQGEWIVKARETK